MSKANAGLIASANSLAGLALEHQETIYSALIVKNPEAASLFDLQCRKVRYHMVAVEAELLKASALVSEKVASSLNEKV